MLWGLYYFMLLTLEKVFLLKKLEKHPLIARVYTIIGFVIGWAIFYITDLGVLGKFIATLFSFTPDARFGYYFGSYIVSIVIGILCSTSLTTKFYNKFKDNNFVMLPLLFVIFILSVAYLVDSTYNPFIYFRF